MINYLWGFMILIGIAVGIVSGQVEQVNTDMLEGAKEAVSLCITMLGIMAFWTGLMEIAREAGIVAAFTRRLQGILKLLFPDIPKDHIANEYIASNMIANILGLGWAATPMGIKAMQELDKIEKEKTGGKRAGVASINMCTFLIINISSLQLIPVNVIAYRSQYGSVNPASIIFMALIATTGSTLSAVIFCMLARRLSKSREKNRQYS